MCVYIYIYVYVVMLLSGPIWGVYKFIIGPSYKLLSGPSLCLAYFPICLCYCLGSCKFTNSVWGCKIAHPKKGHFWNCGTEGPSSEGTEELQESHGKIDSNIHNKFHYLSEKIHHDDALQEQSSEKGFFLHATFPHPEPPSRYHYKHKDDPRVWGLVGGMSGVGAGKKSEGGREKASKVCVLECERTVCVVQKALSLGNCARWLLLGVWHYL